MRFERSEESTISAQDNDASMGDISGLRSPIAQPSTNTSLITPSVPQPTPMRAIDLYSSKEDTITREVTMVEPQDCDYSTILAQTSLLSINHQHNTPKQARTDKTRSTPMCVVSLLVPVSLDLHTATKKISAASERVHALELGPEDSYTFEFTNGIEVPNKC